MFDLLGQVFINLGTFLQQATTGSTEIDSIVSIILAIAAIGGVIATFMKAVPQLHKYGVMMDAGFQKTVENEEMLRRVGAAVVDTVPEVNDALKKHGADLKYLEERFVKGSGQLTLLRDLAIKDKDRARNVEMPRESQKVI